jgi:hypothetical protein
VNRWWSSLRPRIRVFVRLDELVFTGRTEFTVAPIIWFNDAGQVAAVGNEDGRPAFKRLRRVDVLRRDQVLARDGEQGKAAILLLRYAMAMVLSKPANQYWFRPIIDYVEDDGALRDVRRARGERIEAFRVVARRAGAHHVEVPADAAS